MYISVHCDVHIIHSYTRTHTHTHTHTQPRLTNNFNPLVCMLYACNIHDICI